MERDDLASGDRDMLVSDGRLDIFFLLKWGYRALYVLLFVAMVSVMGYLHLPFVVMYLGATMSFLLGPIFSRKELFYYWDFSYLLDE